MESILSVVAMVPLGIIPGAKDKYHDYETSFFIVEKPGLDMLDLTGYKEDDNLDEV